MKYGSQYRSIMDPANAPWTPMGGTGMPYDVFGVVEPDDFSGYLNRAQADAATSNADLARQKFDLFKNFFGKASGGDLFGSGSSSFRPASVPTPNYISAGPIWTQGQINARAGLDRANLIGQANNESRAFSTGMASRGFSPYSPFASFNQQNNLMRAYSGAASNETNLNFNAAKANSDAALQASQINADMYRSYANALGQSNSFNGDFLLKQQGQKQDFITSLLRSLGG